MKTTYVILIGILVVVVLWIIFIYNSLISLRNLVKTAWSGIDVQLKRRADLIPSLVNTVKGYATHEKELLEKITLVRTSMMNASQSGNIKEMAQSNNMLTGALKSLFAVAENYPDLKANQNFLELQKELTETEDQIAAARRIYNENVNYYNTKLESFPSNLIAKMFNFEKKDFFEIEESEKQIPKVEF